MNLLQNIDIPLNYTFVTFLSRQR